jgi:hypothetical protein
MARKKPRDSDEEDLFDLLKVEHNHTIHVFSHSMQTRMLCVLMQNACAAGVQVFSMEHDNSLKSFCTANFWGSHFGSRSTTPSPHSSAQV